MMNHDLTFAELREFLVALGCSESVTPSRITFAYPRIGTFLLFRPYGPEECVSDRDMIVVRRQLVDNGLIDATAFDRFLQKVSA
jgi:hypothetical protein